MGGGLRWLVFDRCRLCACGLQDDTRASGHNKTQRLPADNQIPPFPVDTTITRPETPARSATAPMPSDLDRIAKFYDRLLPMKSGELARELDSSREAFEKDKSDFNRLQLALLLSLPGTTFRDDNAALALLNAFVKDKSPEGSTLRPLAILLHSELLELRRSDEALQQQSAKLKEEQRRSEAPAAETRRNPRNGNEDDRTRTESPQEEMTMSKHASSSSTTTQISCAC
jgi:hypothetical protein